MGNWFSSEFTKIFKERGLYAYEQWGSHGTQIFYIKPDKKSTKICLDVEDKVAYFSITRNMDEEDEDNLPYNVLCTNLSYNKIMINEYTTESLLSNSCCFEYDEENKILKSTNYFKDVVLEELKKKYED